MLLHRKGFAGPVSAVAFSPAFNPEVVGFGTIGGPAPWVSPNVLTMCSLWQGPVVVGRTWLPYGPFLASLGTPYEYFAPTQIGTAGLVCTPPRAVNVAPSSWSPYLSVNFALTAGVVAAPWTGDCFGVTDVPGACTTTAGTSIATACPIAKTAPGQIACVNMVTNAAAAEAYLQQACVRDIPEGDACRTVAGVPLSTCIGFMGVGYEDACAAAVSYAATPAVGDAAKTGFCAVPVNRNRPECSCINWQESSFVPAGTGGLTGLAYEAAYAAKWGVPPTFQDCLLPSCALPDAALLTTAHSNTCPAGIVECMAGVFEGSGGAIIDSSLSLNLANHCVVTATKDFYALRH